MRDFYGGGGIGKWILWRLKGGSEVVDQLSLFLRQSAVEREEK
jgi:hypothetical protein